MHIDTLRAIDGIGIFPVVSLVLFVTVFTVMLVRTARLDRQRLARYAALPFDEARPVSEEK
jgi:hypothetical protein